jgi:hypothetical protein
MRVETVIPRFNGMAWGNGGQGRGNLFGSLQDMLVNMKQVLDRFVALFPRTIIPSPNFLTFKEPKN